MKKRRLSIIAGLLLAAVLAGYIYVIAGSRNVEKMMEEHLQGRGDQLEEIKSIEVYHSFLGPLFSHDRWTIRVRHVDEPGSFYFYTVKDGKIKFAGVSGTVDKEELKHGE